MVYALEVSATLFPRRKRSTGRLRDLHTLHIQGQNIQGSNRDPLIPAPALSYIHWSLSGSIQTYFGPRCEMKVEVLIHPLCVQWVHLWNMKTRQQFTGVITVLTWWIIGSSMNSHAFWNPVLESKVEEISYVRWKYMQSCHGMIITRQSSRIFSKWYPNKRGYIFRKLFLYWKKCRWLILIKLNTHLLEIEPKFVTEYV